jgi:hypothetical protein
MHPDQHGLKHYELTEKIIKVFVEVWLVVELIFVFIRVDPWL